MPTLTTRMRQELARLDLFATRGAEPRFNIASIVGPLIGGQVVDHLDYLWTSAFSGRGRLLQPCRSYGFSSCSDQVEHRKMPP